MKRKYLFPLLILLLTHSGNLSAQEVVKQPLGNQWRLTIDLGVLMMQSNSTLDTNGEKKITDNTQEGNAPQSVWTFPLFDFRYVLADSKTQFFVGTPIEGSNTALSLGASQPLPKIGIISVSVAPSFGVTLWKNPYEENVDRKKTAVDILTTNLKIDNLASTPVHLAYTHRTITIEEDEIGKLYSDLNRNGTIQTVQVTYDIGLTRSSLVSPGLTAERGDMDGQSNRYSQSGLTVSYKQQGQRCMFMVEASANQSLYEKEHPLYGKTRRDDGIGFFALLRIQSLFEVAALHSNIILGAGTVNSNIDFFDNNSSYLALTMGYSF
ncbi:DUF2860 domain-containing protein [bacterium]|nr:DUF2860 domain-containing protein [bacterium]